MKMLILLVGSFYIATAQVQSLSSQGFLQGTEFTTDFIKRFSDKFSCFYDKNGVYADFHKAHYGTNGCRTEAASSTDDSIGTDCAQHYCCGYMANGLKQCDRFSEWSIVSGTHFSLCKTDPDEAVQTTLNNGRPQLRRDLCCANDHFNDCTLCKSFMVWDFTHGSDNVHGGDDTLEAELANGVVTLDNGWRTEYLANDNQRPHFSYTGQDGTTYSGRYNDYAYYNQVFPAGYARGKLREFNDPPICVYAPNTAGRVIEIKVEPDETGNNICVDDLHEDSLERNAPGVTQACDKERLRMCIPDASTETSVAQMGFAFVISCSESCADSDVDLWFRLRSSVNKWTDAGDYDKGTDRTELNTEMWCMWGVQDMRTESDNGEMEFDLKTVMGVEVDGDFSKWDVWPSDLTPPSEPRVQPLESSSFSVSFILPFLMLAASL